MSNRVFELPDSIWAFDRLIFALENGVDNVLELLELTLQRLLVCLCALGVDPFRSSTERLLESFADSRCGSLDEGLVVKVIACTVGEGFERV